MKNFGEYILKSKITDIGKIKKLLVGKKMKVLARGSGHQYPDGIEIKDTCVVGFYGTANAYVGYIQQVNNQFSNNTVYFTEFYVPVSIKKEDFKKELSELSENYLKEKNELESKIALMDEYDLDEYDDDVIRISKALDVLESTKSKRAKVAALRELIR